MLTISLRLKRIKKYAAQRSAQNVVIRSRNSPVLALDATGGAVVTAVR